MSEPFDRPTDPFRGPSESDPGPFAPATRPDLVSASSGPMDATAVFPPTPVATSDAADGPGPWAEPEFVSLPPVTPPPAIPPRPSFAAKSPDPRPRRSASLLPMILAAALLSGLLASAGTYGFLRLSGALDQPTPAPSLAPSPSPASSPPAASPAPAASGPVGVLPPSNLMTVVARVSPAIVTIVSSLNPPVAGSDPNTPPGTDVGSGVIFDSAGWILTNKHVVSGGGKLQITLSDGRQFSGTIYGVDTLTDLAIVKIAATDLSTAPLGDSATAAVGQAVISIGDPLGIYPNSVTSGIISALGRTIQVADGTFLRDLIQTDAPINPGNSGGALLDASGAVIGITSATAANAQGIGFALPINVAKPIMSQALAGQQLARPWLGIRYLALSPALATQYKLPVNQGAWLQPASSLDPTAPTGPAVVAGSPADKAGLKDGDIITAIDGIQITVAIGLDDLMAKYAPGASLSLEVLRDGKTLNLTLVLGTRPANL